MGQPYIESATALSDLWTATTIIYPARLLARVIKLKFQNSLEEKRKALMKN